MNEDTICAIATAQGGALGIIRVSGPDAIAIVDGMFYPSSIERKLSSKKSHTISHGLIKDSNGEVLDEVLVSLFKSPHSYTGEDSIEISCHASPYILKTIMQLLIENGCRQAEPGEFTLRAFLNGKMDLAQAEAVADVIASETSASHKMAISQMRGGVSRELLTLRDKLLNITTLLELELDFSDHEELEFADRKSLLLLTQETEGILQKLVNSFSLGNAIKNGIPMVIVGKPNAGKSTLLNALLEDDRAIVSNTPGTTRDTIEELLNIDGITYRIIDTAGLGKTQDEIEHMGVQRTIKKLSEAKIILLVVDATLDEPIYQFPKDILFSSEDKRLIIVYNKIDIASKVLRDKKSSFENGMFKSVESICISAKMKTNIDELKCLIASDATFSSLLSSDTVLTNVRHYETLKKALSALQRVKDSINSNLSTDLLSQDLRESIQLVGQVLGDEITSGEVLENIFSNFCIGK